MAVLKEQVAAPELSHIIITHVGPNRIPTLKLLLEEALTGRSAGTPLKLVVTNPAKAVLEKGLAGKPELVTASQLLAVCLVGSRPSSSLTAQHSALTEHVWPGKLPSTNIDSAGCFSALEFSIVWCQHPTPDQPFARST